MGIIYHNEMEQNTPEWYEARTGIVTASQMSVLVTPTLKISAAKGVKSHAYEMAAQRILKHVEETFQTWDMARGHVEEIYAKDLYSKNYAQVVDCGFITNDNFGYTVGFSPDGLVGDDGFIEVKSRKQRIQAETIIENEVPKDDMLQIQSGFFASGRKWCDFISYSNGMPMFVKRVFPDPATQTAIAEATSTHETRIQLAMAAYKQNSADFFVAPRRDADTGATIKPSEGE